MSRLPASARQLAARIDQTNLKPQATRADMEAFLRQVRQENFATAAILPLWAPLAAEILDGCQVAVDPAVGFPLGSATTRQKAAETAWCIRNSGARVEIDMVMNLALFKSGHYRQVVEDIRAVVEAAEGRTVKVIIESPLLSREEIVIASQLGVEGGAHFIKTSTGFRAFPGWRPSTPAEVMLIRSAIGEQARIKISGGMTSTSLALAALSAGADRIGTAFGIEILDGFRRLAGE